MILTHLTQRLPASGFAKLLIGSVIVALAISLGMVWILQAFRVSIDPAIPATTAAIGAAIYAARTRSQNS